MPTGAQELFGAGAVLFRAEFTYLSTYFHKPVYRFLENTLCDWIQWSFERTPRH